MEMDFAQLRIAALLLVTVAAGLFGYSFGWERGQIAAKTESDRQIRAVQEHIARQDATLLEHSAAPAPQPVSGRPPA